MHINIYINLIIEEFNKVDKWLTLREFHNLASSFSDHSHRNIRRVFNRLVDDGILVRKKNSAGVSIFYLNKNRKL